MSDLIAQLEALIEKEQWRAASILPEVSTGNEKTFIVAVRRARNGKVYSFPALYLNAFPLRYEYECPKGDGCCGDGCDDGCPTTGWYSEEGDGDDGRTYTKLSLSEGDEFLAWRAVPQHEDNGALCANLRTLLDALRTATTRAEALERERDEARGWATEWHRIADTICTCLGLGALDADQIVGAVRSKFEAAERENERLRARSCLSPHQSRRATEGMETGA